MHLQGDGTYDGKMTPLAYESLTRHSAFPMLTFFVLLHSQALSHTLVMIIRSGPRTVQDKDVAFHLDETLVWGC